MEQPSYNCDFCQDTGWEKEWERSLREDHKLVGPTYSPCNVCEAGDKLLDNENP